MSTESFQENEQLSALTRLKRACCAAIPRGLSVAMLGAMLLLAQSGNAQEGAAIDQAGPFGVHGTGYDADAPQPQHIARDGTAFTQGLRPYGTACLPHWLCRA